VRDNVPRTKKIAKSCGYEILTASQGKTRAKLRATHKAKQLYFSGHGLHASASLEFPEEPSNFAPADLTSEWKDLEIAIIAGCSVLDINDYTHEFDGGPREAVGFEPGVRWHDVIGGGNAILLGYRHWAPLGPVTDAQIMQEFTQLTSARPSSEAILWLKANINKNDNDSAVAIDGEDRYWFVDYDKVSARLRSADGSFRPFPGRRWGTNRRIVHIEKGPAFAKGWTDGRATRDQHHRVTHQYLNRNVDIYPQ